MYTTILFDFFDVILSDPYKAWIAKHKLHDRKEEFDRLMEPLDLGQTTIDELLIKYNDLTGQSLENLTEDFDKAEIVDERMVPLIESLKQYYKIGLLSNASTKEIRPRLEKHDFERLFDHVFVSGEVGLIKPMPEAFQHILDKLNSRPDESIFIDDSPTNVAAAKTVGITAILYTGFNQLEADLKSLGIKLN